MQLTGSQLDTLKTWLTSNAGGLNDEAAAALLNAAGAAPNNVAWRRGVPLAEVSTKINGTELAGLTTGNHTRLQTVVVLINSAGGVRPELADQRSFWADIFSGAGGAITRPALLALWKRTVTVGEKLFATGTGSDANPMTFGTNATGGGLFGVSLEGLITTANISEARNRP
mgnify:CR=1 FL=1